MRTFSQRWSSAGYEDGLQHHISIFCSLHNNRKKREKKTQSWFALVLLSMILLRFTAFCQLARSHHVFTFTLAWLRFITSCSLFFSSPRLQRTCRHDSHPESRWFPTPLKQHTCCPVEARPLTMELETASNDEEAAMGSNTAQISSFIHCTT